MRVCVLGAGIVGLSTAYALMQRGHAVTVVDRAGAAAGASGGNGAQLSYSYVQPLADPSIWAQLPKLLFSPSSPLRLRPQLDPSQWRWGLQFLMACNAGRSHATTRRLLLLAAQSRVHFEQMLERENLACDFSSTGKLVLLRTPQGLAAAARQMQLQRAMNGPHQELMDRAQVLAAEPALAATHDPIAGAVFTPSECAADCHKVCLELARVLQDRGCRLLLNMSAQAFVTARGRVGAVRTSGGDIEADAFVMALGAGSRQLAGSLGLRLPLYPLKGYSITLALDGVADGVAPRVNVTDSARKVVFARIGNRLRVAGMAELVGDDSSIPESRIETLKAATASLFPGCAARSDVLPWTGMRPATPTGEPIVGRHPRGPDNLILNTGHGALGFTLAFGTAQQVTQALPAA